jgi:NAD+ kinase
VTDDAPRRILLLAHTGREDARAVACEVVHALRKHDIAVRLLADEAAQLGLTEPEVELIGEVDGDAAADDCELAVVIGGDGTILRAAEATHATAPRCSGSTWATWGSSRRRSPTTSHFTIDAIVHRRYTAEDRLTIDVAVYQDGELVTSTWALNEASVEKAARERMLEVVVEIDGRPLSRWGCDGVVCATPTGQHRLQLLAGGPVVWPAWRRC